MNLSNKISEYKYLLNYSSTWSFITVLSVAVIEILFISKYYDLLTLVILAVWIYVLSYSPAAKLAHIPVILVFIFFMPIFLMFDAIMVSEKLAVWIFYLLAVSIVQKTLELRRLEQ